MLLSGMISIANMLSGAFTSMTVRSFGKAQGLRTHNDMPQANKFNPDKVLLVGNAGLPWQDFLKLNPVSLF
jgi:hypothetical protein